MSYLVNGKNIAPIAFGSCTAGGVGSNLFNCSVTTINGNLKTFTFLNGNSYAAYSVIGCSNTSAGGGTIVCAFFLSSTQFQIFTQAGSVSNSQGFSFVVFSA
jgi:hypothetical protein